MPSVEPLDLHQTLVYALIASLATVRQAFLFLPRDGWIKLTSYGVICETHIWILQRCNFWITTSGKYGNLKSHVHEVINRLSLRWGSQKGGIYQNKPCFVRRSFCTSLASRSRCSNTHSRVRHSRRCPRRIKSLENFPDDQIAFVNGLSVCGPSKKVKRGIRTRRTVGNHFFI